MRIIVASIGLAAIWTLPAAAQDSGLQAEFDAYGAHDVVPPDIIESGLNQDRLEASLGSDARIAYDLGSALIDFRSSAEIYPGETRYNRFSVGPGVRIDLPLTEDRRTRLRLGGSYQYVFGDEGHVFDRVRVDAQLIRRHSAEHTSTMRIRYGYRNQSEDRFTGFDQDEWLGELRHVWRPDGGPSSLSLSLLGLRHDAQDDRFTYDGYGFRLLGKTPLANGLTAIGRLSIVQRDYQGDFSSAFPLPREDRHLRVTAGLEQALASGISIFGEAGYVDNYSNIPLRDYDGFTGRIGLSWRLED